LNAIKTSQVNLQQTDADTLLIMVNQIFGKSRSNSNISDGELSKLLNVTEDKEVLCTRIISLEHGLRRKCREAPKYKIRTPENKT
jgi:hypothetical protein